MRKNGFVLALTPALSPGEREKHSPRSDEVGALHVRARSGVKVQELATATAASKLFHNATTEIPSPGGEGQGEGEPYL